MRLPAAAAAGPTGPGMPQTHHLARPGPPGAARELLRPPNSRTPAGASRAATGRRNEQMQKRQKAAAPRPERAAAAAAAAAAMPSMRTVPPAPLAATPVPLVVPERRIQVLLACRQGWLEGGSRRIRREKWGSEGGGAPKLTSKK